MARPPRDISVERLVSIPLLTYSYIIVGLAESLCCMGAYLWVFKHNGVSAGDIFLLDPQDEQWFSDADRINEMKLPTIGGKVFSSEDQERIVREVRLNIPHVLLAWTVVNHTSVTGPVYAPGYEFAGTRTPAEPSCRHNLDLITNSVLNEFATWQNSENCYGLKPYLLGFCGAVKWSMVHYADHVPVLAHLVLQDSPHQHFQASRFI